MFLNIFHHKVIAYKALHKVEDTGLDEGIAKCTVQRKLDMVLCTFCRTLRRISTTRNSNSLLECGQEMTHFSSHGLQDSDAGWQLCWHSCPQSNFLPHFFWHLGCFVLLNGFSVFDRSMHFPQGAKHSCPHPKTIPH